jgi:hypothetical protein
VLERFDMSLGAGLGRLKGNVFRIGHLGDFNDLMLAGTLSGVEMGPRSCRCAVHTGRRDRRPSSTSRVTYLERKGTQNTQRRHGLAGVAAFAFLRHDQRHLLHERR